MYVDDLIVINADNNVITHEVGMMMKFFWMKDLAPVNEYLGVKVDWSEYPIKLTQPQLIQKIIDNVKIPANAKTITTLEIAGKVLNQGLNKLDHDPKIFDY